MICYAFMDWITQGKVLLDMINLASSREGRKPKIYTVEESDKLKVAIVHEIHCPLFSFKQSD